MDKKVTRNMANNHPYHRMNESNKQKLQALFDKCWAKRFECRLVIEIENPKELSVIRNGGDYFYYMVDFSADGEMFDNDTKAVVSSSRGYWHECKSVEEALEIICKKCKMYYTMYLDRF